MPPLPIVGVQSARMSCHGEKPREAARVTGRGSRSSRTVSSGSQSSLSLALAIAPGRRAVDGQIVASTGQRMWPDQMRETDLDVKRFPTPQVKNPNGNNAAKTRSMAFGSSPSCSMISDTSTWSRKPCNPSTTRSARGCHPCLRYDLLPMCPGWTICSSPRIGFRTQGPSTPGGFQDRCLKRLGHPSDRPSKWRRARGRKQSERNKFGHDYRRFRPRTQGLAPAAALG